MRPRYGILTDGLSTGFRHDSVPLPIRLKRSPVKSLSRRFFLKIFSGSWMEALYRVTDVFAKPDLRAPCPPGRTRFARVLLEAGLAWCAPSARDESLALAMREDSVAACKQPLMLGAGMDRGGYASLPSFHFGRSLGPRFGWGLARQPASLSFLLILYHRVKRLSGNPPSASLRDATACRGLTPAVMREQSARDDPLALKVQKHDRRRFLCTAMK